jgi:hypothetical protein
MSMQTSLLSVDCKRICKGAFSAGHQMGTVPMFASLVVNPRRSIAPAAQLRRRYHGTCHFSSRDLAVQHGRHHPCWKAAHFLPCTRPPDVMRMHRPPKIATYGPSQRHAFVATSSGHRHARAHRAPAPMYSAGHILSAPGFLATFFQGLLIWRELPLSTSSGAFSFILSILW